MSRIVIVSNRLPVTVKLSDAGVAVERSPGGLATGLRGPHERSQGLWIGWDGVEGPIAERHRPALRARMEELGVVPVSLTRRQVERHYEGYSNGILWPLFHYFTGQLPIDRHDFGVYREVNERFADVVAAHHRSGDSIWVQDYQLMLLPELIRRRLPDARIGFFLHIPFPSSEVFRTLPQRAELLEGVLGADLVGFHTPGYMLHFESAVLRIHGVATEIDGIPWRRRRVRLGVYPMGVDFAAFESLARDPEVTALAARFRGDGDAQLLVGIDRLDYTKGIPRRLLAFETLLRTHPELAGRVRLVQVAVPSRGKVGAYREFREQVERIVGRIHGAFATPSWVPVHYMFRSLSEAEVAALYRAADVMLVTPVRDGMNLVAKEFVAARVDEGGVLVLSEFAGASCELAEAVMVNPYDVEGCAEAYHAALTMAPVKRRTRMRALRRRVQSYDVHRWAESFLDDLARPDPVPSAASTLPTPPERVDALAARLRRAPYLVLLLDYDGTLVPIANTPELAAPDPELLDLLRALAARPHTEVHILSGRVRETLDAWLGDLPAGLYAEHGYWSRPPGTRVWEPCEIGAGGVREKVLAILRDASERTPGSLVEEKSVSLAWHYRMADPQYGEARANELRLHLGQALSNAPVEVLPGNKVIEIRPHGVHKGRVVPTIADGKPAGTVFVAMGDDRTDQDMFAALPAGGVSVQVGEGALAADYRLDDVAAGRRFLSSLLRGTDEP